MLRLYRAWLREWQGHSAPRIYFVTWWLFAPQRMLAPVERDLIRDLLLRGHGDRYQLKAFVIMDDHVHVLVQLIGLPVERIVQSWRSFSAHQLQRLYRRRGRVWRESWLSTSVVSEEDVRKRAEYIVGNPWKRWPFVKGYRWVWWEPEGLLPGDVQEMDTG